MNKHSKKEIINTLLKEIADEKLKTPNTLTTPSMIDLLSIHALEGKWYEEKNILDIMNCTKDYQKFESYPGEYYDNISILNTTIYESEQYRRRNFSKKYMLINFINTRKIMDYIYNDLKESNIQNAFSILEQWIKYLYAQEVDDILVNYPWIYDRYDYFRLKNLLDEMKQ